MQWGTLDPFEYHPHRGLYWHEVSRGLICGTQPRSSHDVSALADIGVTHILNLQVNVLPAGNWINVYLKLLYVIADRQGYAALECRHQVIFIYIHRSEQTSLYEIISN